MTTQATTAAHATQTAATIAVGDQSAETKAPEAPKTAEQVLYNEETKTPETTTETKEEVKEESKTEEVFELALPENSFLDPAVVDEIKEYAKAEKLSASQAQKLLEREHNALNNYHQKIRQNAEAQTQAWFNDVKNDRELGGENFSRSAELAKRVMDRFGSDQLKQALNETGLGNNPELVRLLVNIGKNMSEDSLVHGQNHTGGGLSAAQLLYGKS